MAEELGAYLNRVSADILRATSRGIKRGTIRLWRVSRKNAPKGVYKNKKGGTLRRSINARMMGALHGEVYTNLEYAPYVEFGHRIVNKNKDTVGYVEPNPYMRRAADQCEDAIVEDVLEEIERVL